MSEYDIFLQALEIPAAGEQAAFLAQACAGDSALRKRVEELLDAHDRPGAFLDVPVLRQMENQAMNSPTTGGTHIDPAAGESGIDLSFLQPSGKAGSLGRLQHYEVREVLGRGGCGVVLKAFDERLHRVVAIKIMAPSLAATSPARKRFLREARATAAIRHENVVNIYAVDEVPLPFLVMEYVDGPTLQRKLDESGPLDPKEILSIGLQVARGLEAAHQKDLIHRDIKPANILIERGSGRVKITDFGLARSVDDASLTQSGAIAGTPLYMSPEQAQGRAVDMRSDLFSFGSLLYVMSTGRPPFRAATALAVMKRVVEEQPRPIREIIPEAPASLVSLIDRLHAKDPAQRPKTMKDVRSQLARQLQEARPHEAAPPLPKTATGRPSLEGGDLQERRHGVDGIVGAAQAQGHRRVLAVVGLLLLCAALVGMLWRRRSLSPTTPTTVPASVSVPVSVPAVAVAPDGDALSPDPLVGKWEVRGGPDLRLRFLTDFQADGTTETVVLPETIAEMRRLKLPLPKMTVDHGRWTRDEKGEYRITHRMGATIQFTVNGDQFIGANAAGDVTTGSRVVSSGAPRSPPADAGQKDPVLGKWLIRSGPELSIILHVEYRPDGTALTTFPPETLAEIRKRKLLVPRENPDVGVWVQDSPGEYRHSFSGGRTVRFTVDRNAFRGRNPMGDRLVGLRQVTEEDPPSTE